MFWILLKKKKKKKKTNKKKKKKKISKQFTNYSLIYKLQKVGVFF